MTAGTEGLERVPGLPEWRACSSCRHVWEHRIEHVRISGPVDIITYSTCGRTGWSLDFERSKSGACGPEGARFEEAETEAPRGPEVRTE